MFFSLIFVFEAFFGEGMIYRIGTAQQLFTISASK